MVCVLASKLDIRACCAPPRFRFKEPRIAKVEEGGCYIAFGFDWPSPGPSFDSQPPLFADAHFIEWRRTIRSCLIAWRSLRYGIKKLTHPTLFFFFDPFLTGGEPSSLLSWSARFPPKGSKGPTCAFCWLSMPRKKKRIVQSWRGIGLYPDERLKKKAMCAPPFLERWLQRAFMNLICEVEPSPLKVRSLKK